MRDKGGLINLGAENGINPAVATLVKFDNFPSKVAVMDEYCTNPGCDCRDITLGFFEIVDNEIKDVIFKILMNVDTWEMIKHQVFKKNIDCEGMIGEFLRDIDDKTKLIIKKRFETGKKFGSEVLRENIDYSILQKGNCICYAEIFNSKDFTRFKFEYKGTKYTVLDRYCTNPKCYCNDVVLAFNELDTQANLHSFKFNLRLKFKTGKYKVEDRIENVEDREAEEIYRYFMQNLNDPDFGLLKNRYDNMKKLSIALEQNSSEVSNRKNMISEKFNDIKIGRNVPCPCGSGKKYKKCCLS